MKYKLYKYQEKAVKNLITHSMKLLNSSEDDKYILLKAITGAGKTVITGAYIEEMFEEVEDLAFVWITVGTGGLHLQSRTSLIEKLSPSISVKMIDEALRDDVLHHKDILVLNWESLNTTKVDPETKEVYFNNLIMKGEGRTFQELCSRTIDSGTKIILIIDESHKNSTTKTSKAIIDLINPIFTLEMTATPDEKRIPSQDDAINKKAFYEKIITTDVIEEEVIKKSIILNDVSRTTEESDSSVEFILNQAILKRNELKRAYELEEEDINPLCIIQLPDGNISDDLKKEVLNILSNSGYYQSNDKVAIWLDKEKTHEDSVVKLINSPVDFLIFKHRVATGWDCPRASILVRLREVKSIAFDLQTLGRILRMPYRKYYSNEILNNGYVYTNSDYFIKAGDYDDQVLPIRQVLKKEFRDEVLNLEFESEKIEISKNPIDTKIIEASFKEKMSKQYLNLDLDDLALNIKKTKTDVSEFDKTKKSNISSVLIEETLLKLTKQDINKEFEKLIKGISNTQYPYKNLTNIVKRYFANIDGLEGDYAKQKQAVLLNKDLVIQCFNEIKLEYKNTIPTTVNTIAFSFKEDRYTSEKNTISYNKCAYFKHFVSKYDTETTFEKYLEELDNVLYWIKNVDSGDGISLVYEYEKVKHEFYPDYVVKFKNGDIGLYEVKHIDDNEKDTITRVKIEKLREYCLDNGYRGGKIEIKDNKVYMPTLPSELR